MNRTQKPYGIRIPVELLDELRKLAKEDARSLNSEILWALYSFVELRRKSLTKKVAR